MTGASTMRKTRPLQRLGSFRPCRAQHSRHTNKAHYVAGTIEMNRYSLTAIALICLIALVQLIVSRQFARHIETLRSMAAGEQLSGVTTSQDLPEIMRLFAVRNGATLGGPASVLRTSTPKCGSARSRISSPSRLPSSRNPKAGVRLGRLGQVCRRRADPCGGLLCGWRGTA